MSTLLDNVMDDITRIHVDSDKLIKRVGLFGSMLRDNSIVFDVDILLEVLPGSEREVHKKLHMLQLSLPIGKVDFITYDSIHFRKYHKLYYHFLLVPIGKTERFLGNMTNLGGKCIFI